MKRRLQYLNNFHLQIVLKVITTMEIVIAILIHHRLWADRFLSGLTLFHEDQPGWLTQKKVNFGH